MAKIHYLATSYSYNSVSQSVSLINLIQNLVKLLQTSPNPFQTLPNPICTCPNPVQTCPKTSKRLQTCPNASKCSKCIQTCSNFNGIFLLCTRKISPQNLKLQFKIFFLPGLGGLPTSQPKLRCQQIWVEISVYYNPWPSPTFIPNHFPLLATFVHSLLDNFFYYSDPECVYVRTYKYMPCYDYGVSLCHDIDM